MYTGPSWVSSVPWRAMRVGKHESKVSTPSAAPAQMEGSSAMPSRWLGLSGGMLGARVVMWLDGWMDGWMDGRMDGWMDGWMGG